MCALIINQQAMNLKITSFLFALSVLLTANSCDNTSQIEDQIDMINAEKPHRSMTLIKSPIPTKATFPSTTA